MGENFGDWGNAERERNIGDWGDAEGKGDDTRMMSEFENERKTVWEYIKRKSHEFRVKAIVLKAIFDVIKSNPEITIEELNISLDYSLAVLGGKKNE